MPDFFPDFAAVVFLGLALVSSTMSKALSPSCNLFKIFSRCALRSRATVSLFHKFT